MKQNSKAAERQRLRREQRRNAAKQEAIRRQQQKEAMEKKQYVQPIYQDRAAFCFATGPSLKEWQVKCVEPFHTAGKVLAFGLNDAYRIVPYLDVLYACDPKWWDVHMLQDDHQRYDLAGYPAQKWTQCAKSAEKYKVNHIPGRGTKGFGVGNIIHFGSNSGYQLLNLAYLFGIRKFYLLGYDMHVPQGEKQHFFGPHPKPLARGDHYKSFCNNYNTIQAEIKQMIINCTPGSALTCFEKRNLDEVLNAL